MSIKIAFLMQCHKNSSQINQLLKVLNKTYDECDVYIHVDKKTQRFKVIF